MKKILLTAACLFVASQSSAYTLTGITMDFYDASNTFIGYHTTVTGSIDTSAAIGHLVSDLPLFTDVFVGDVQWHSESAGQNTWAGHALTTSYGDIWTSFNYTFNLAPGDVAVGMYFDWINGSGDTINNIPVLSVFRPNYDAAGSMSPVDQVWYKGTTTSPKLGMQTAPFPGWIPKFSAAAGGPAVPEPASLLLIGSGLAGLVGLAGRRRRGH